MKTILPPVLKLQSQINRCEVKLEYLKHQLNEEKNKGHNILPSPSIIEDLVKNQTNVITLEFDKPNVNESEKTKTSRGRPKKLKLNSST